MVNILESRETWIELDLSKFRANLDRVIELAQGKIVWPAVKANCYGHGIDVLFPSFISQGIKHFCVAYIDEAQYLQRLANDQNVTIQILIFGDIPIECLQEVQENWHVTVAHSTFAEQLLAFQSLKKIRIQFKLDTGMNRRGFKTNLSFMEYYNKMQDNENFIISGIYTHLATADNEPNSTFMLEQLKRFQSLAGDVRDEVEFFHAQNSFGLANLYKKPDIIASFNATRPGGICYGLSVQDEHIQPIASLYSKIMEVKQISKGEFVSYNITFEAEEDGYLAVLPIGYADGVARHNSGNHIWLNGEIYPIVGKICMEQCIIFTPNPDKFYVGDTVEFFGENISLARYAAYNDTIDYEVMCQLAPRVKRITIEKVV